MIDPSRRIVLLEKMRKEAGAYDDFLDKVRGTVDKAKNAPVFGGASLADISRNTGEAMWKGPSKVAAKPFESMSEKAKRLLLGEKALVGPHKGKRLHAVPGGLGEGIKQISRAEYEAIKAGKKAGEAMTGTVGKDTAYFARKFRPKGAVGTIMKHPGKSALGALALYWLMKDKGSRQAAGEVARGMSPKFVKGPTEDVKKEWSKDLNYKNPLAEEAWG